MRRILLSLAIGCALASGGCGDDADTTLDAGRDAAPDDDEHNEAGIDPGIDAGGSGGSSGSGGSGADARVPDDVDAGHDPEGDGGSSSAGACDGPLLPMAVGNAWTYRVTHPADGVSTKKTVIEGKEAVGGSGPNADKQAFHAVTTKTSGALTDTTESWQGVLGDGSVVRYREVAYKAGSTMPNGEEHWQPYKLRVDESEAHLVEAATWTETYTESKIDSGAEATAERKDGWVVEGVDVPCGPVQGEMLSCIKLRKRADGAADGKTYWYARCVGKVREEGAQTEELTDYTVK